VVLLMLIPLLAPSPDGSSGGMGKIAQALGIAGAKAVACIVGVIGLGRLVVKPLFDTMAGLVGGHAAAHCHCLEASLASNAVVACATAPCCLLLGMCASVCVPHGHCIAVQPLPCLRVDICSVCCWLRCWRPVCQ
jgi:hypothetical protein